MKKSEFNVFLGNSPWRQKGRLGVRAGSRWPFSMPASSGEKVPDYAPFPFFLGYATAVLEEAGYGVMLIDGITMGLNEEAFISTIRDFGPKLVVLETSTPTFSVDLKTAERVKSVVPETRIALSGPHVSIMRSEIIRDNPFIDFILIGEYEMSLLELCECLREGGDPSEVKGIIYRNGGEAADTGRREVIEDLDALPRPAYHHLPMYNYNDDFRVLEKPNVQMWTSRGCPFKCIFCMWPQVMYGNHRYRVRDSVKVVDEMEWLVRTYGFRGIYIDDDTFNMGKKRLTTLSREIKRRRLNVPWGAMARADTMDEETLAAMADAGLAGIKYGVESAVQAIVDRSKKDLDLEKALNMVELTKKYGVKVHLTFTFGLPGETRETIRRTIDLALAMKTHSAQFSIATPFPGTEFFDELKADNRILSENWDHYDGNFSAVMAHENLSAGDLQNALNEAVTRYWRERSKWV